MSSRRRSRDLRQFCARVDFEDGVDPRGTVPRHDRSRRKQERKAQQLCKQAYQTLAITLNGQCGDPVLQDLSLVGVEATPDGSDLIVAVQLTTLDGQVGTSEVFERLARVRGFLRSELAAVITRKRAPELSFRILTRQEGSP
jgi:ribosome-binding factor A